MTLPPDKIGDQGQRYFIETFGYPKPNQWNNAAYCTHADDAKALAKGLRLIPSVKDVRITDRAEVRK